MPPWWSPLSLAIGSGNQRLQCHESKSKSQQGRRSHVRKGSRRTFSTRRRCCVPRIPGIGLRVGPSSGDDKALRKSCFLWWPLFTQPPSGCHKKFQLITHTPPRPDSSDVQGNHINHSANDWDDFFSAHIRFFSFFAGFLIDLYTWLW